MQDLLLVPLADAFLQVGVFVAVLVALVAWTRVRYGETSLDVLVRHPRLAPFLGALAGVTPGCGGTILVTGLYLKGRASYGAAIASLTATMGDAAFVIIAYDQLHAVLLVAGTVTGYAVDAVALDPRRSRTRVMAGGPTSMPPTPVPPTCPPPPASTAGLDLPATLLWVVTGLALLVVLPATFGLLDPASLTALFGGLDVALGLGLLGTAACGLVFVRSGCRLRDEAGAVPGNLAAALRHGANETAFVVVWVAAALLVVEIFSALALINVSTLMLTGLTGVLIGVAVGVLPGCGVHIAFTGLYAAGALPLPALVANAVAQDGDALLPMLAQDRRTAVVTTLLTSAPALLVGVGALVVLGA